MKSEVCQLDQVMSRTYTSTILETVTHAKTCALYRGEKVCDCEPVVSVRKAKTQKLVKGRNGWREWQRDKQHLGT